uniref:Uncharacterized protein n=1 Tax=Heterorhabditis bacteriophora TaxID=37862 RepID=A0A1I7WMA9_HETBA
MGNQGSIFQIDLQKHKRGAPALNCLSGNGACLYTVLPDVHMRGFMVFS